MSVSAISPKKSGPNPICAWVGSSIGKKAIVAITGLLLIGFVIVHLLGNLTIFLGPAAINAYSQKLRDLGALLWVARIGLVAIFGLHIWATVCLIIGNRRADSKKYVYGNKVPATIFVKTMRYTGFIILAFVIFHLAHFTLGYVQPEVFAKAHESSPTNVYALVVAGFQIVPISIFYILSLIFLTFHLSHGIGSMFQTLGINNQELRSRLHLVGKFVAWILCIGYVSIPIAVLLGII